MIQYKRPKAGAPKPKEKPLNDRQEKFCRMVAGGMTQVQAFKDAGYSWQNYKDPKKIDDAAATVANSPRVAARILELTKRKQAVAEREFDITVKKLLVTFCEIAFTDPNELISVRAGACRHCWGVGGAFQWKEREYLEALAQWERAHAQWAALPIGKRGEEPLMPDCSGGFGYLFTADPNPECVECEGEGISRIVPKDTTKLSPGALHLYRGAQQTKEGLKINFADKDAAMDKIARILGAYDDRLRVDLKGQMAALQLTTTDPQEAAQAYERMLRGS